MLSLTIHHNIHLTKEQRYALHEGQEIQAIGISVPVWFSNKITTEPAREIFCKYFISNPKKDVPIQVLEDGYDVSLPYREGTKLDISDEEWRYLNLQKPDVLESMYKNMIQEVSSKNLLDPEDGGSACLIYREHNKIKKGDSHLTIMHFVCMYSMDLLTNSLN